MNSSQSSQKRRGKSSYSEISEFDLFYQLTHMSAVATAGISRGRIFELGAQLPSATSYYFEQITSLHEEFRYDYPTACRTIGERVKDYHVKSFLLRLANSLESGEPLSSLLAQEARVQGDNYSNGYERGLESMKKWSDAFSSMIVSATLIVIINLVSTMIYQMGPGVMAGLMVTAILMAFFGAWVLAKSAPIENIVVPAEKGSAEQRLTLQLIKILVPLDLLAVAGMIGMGVNRGLIFILSGLFILPAGIVSLLSDSRTTKKDAEISSFLRSLGGTATSIRTTLKEALSQLDLQSYPVLKNDIERLYARLNAMMDPLLCWERFGFESGSQLIKQVTGVFFDAVTLGADPERVGRLCSFFAQETSLLRAKRTVVVSTFSWLTIVMHVIVSAVMIFVLEIIRQFSIMIENVMAVDMTAPATQFTTMPMMNLDASMLSFLDSMTILMLVLFALANALAIIGCDGGSKIKTTFYLAVLLILSGVSCVMVPPLVIKVLPI